MASTYSDNLKLELIGGGDQTGTWGATTNNNLGTALEEAIVGSGSVVFTNDANLTLTLTNSNTTQLARNFYLTVTSSVSLSTQRDLIVPTIRKTYAVRNGTTGGQSIRVKTAAGTGVVIPNGIKTLLYVDGTNVIEQADFIPVDGTVTTAKLADGAVTTAKLANDSVATAKLVDGAVTTAKLADGSVTTAKLAPVIAPVVSSLNGGQLAGFRNRIINGAMAIDQRNNGALVSITTGSALAYTVDRWFVWVTGTGNIAGVQRVSSGTSPNEFLLRIGNGGSGRTVRVAQRIEASDSQDLAGTVATLSADLARTPTSGTVVTWTASYANTRDSFGTVAAPTKTQIATGNFTISNTVTRYSTQISIPSAAITGIEIEFSWITSSTVSDNVIGRVQLEPGSVATPFEHLPIGAELALCQRYFFRSSIGVPASASYAATFSFKVTMRATPTITGGGAGFTLNTTNDNPNHVLVSQTTFANQTLSAESEL